MVTALYQTVTNTIIEALERGVVPWRKPWSFGSAIPVNAATNRPYRGVNVFLLSLQLFSDHRWMTYKQVQERKGKVRPGEKSTMVVFWKRPEPPDPDDPNESAKPQVPLLRKFHVFNVDQCEELRLANRFSPAPEAPHERIERADLLIQSMPNPPRIVETGRAAWYRPSDDLVTVPPLKQFYSADAFYATLFHELGHSTGIQSRLNRAGVTGEIQFASGEYSKEELVAEMTAAYCCATIGLDNSLIEDSASYIQGWLTILKADPKAVVIAAAQAQRAADYIRGVTYH
jgi:antirestriction protein ArdC